MCGFFVSTTVTANQSLAYRWEIRLVVQKSCEYYTTQNMHSIFGNNLRQSEQIEITRNF